MFYFSLSREVQASLLLKERPRISRPPEMSKQTKLLCLFDGASVEMKELTSHSIIHGSEIVNVPFSLSLSFLFFCEPFQSLPILYVISASIASVRHQFHRQLVKITHMMGNGLINECILR